MTRKYLTHRYGVIQFDTPTICIWVFFFWLGELREISETVRLYLISTRSSLGCIFLSDYPKKNIGKGHIEAILLSQFALNGSREEEGGGG